MEFAVFLLEFSNVVVVVVVSDWEAGLEPGSADLYVIEEKVFPYLQEGTTWLNKQIDDVRCSWSHATLYDCCILKLGNFLPYHHQVVEEKKQ